MKEFSNRNTVDQHERYYNHTALSSIKAKTSETADIEVNGSLSTLGGYYNASGGRLIGNMYGVCSTAATTTAKTVSIDGFELVVGQLVTVLFQNYVPSNSTLNVNGTGAYAIRYKTLAIKLGKVSSTSFVTMIWDGLYYQVISVTNDDWMISPTFLNSWNNYATVNGGAWALCGYMKDSSGIVHLQGLLVGGAISDSLPIMQLPIGYRPSGVIHLPVTSADAYGQVRIETDGKVYPSRGSVYWYSLSGINFMAAA